MAGGIGGAGVGGAAGGNSGGVILEADYATAINSAMITDRMGAGLTCRKQRWREWRRRRCGSDGLLRNDLKHRRGHDRGRERRRRCIERQRQRSDDHQRRHHHRRSLRHGWSENGSAGATGDAIEFTGGTNSLTLNAGSAITGAISLDTATTTLTFAQPTDVTLGASVTGFVTDGDAFDLTTIASTAMASHAIGTLTVAAGTNSDTITTAAAPSGDEYIATNDGQGHALVKLAAIPAPTITVPKNGTGTNNNEPTISGTGEVGDTTRTSETIIGCIAATRVPAMTRTARRLGRTRTRSAPTCRRPGRTSRPPGSRSPRPASW